MATRPTDPQQFVALMPFAEHLGIQLDAANPQQVRGRLPWNPELCTVGGALHGGVLMTLADSTAAVCAHLNLPEGASTATVESKTNFFRAVREGTVHATSSPLHAGRNTVVLRTELVDDQQRQVGFTTQTQTILTSPRG